MYMGIENGNPFFGKDYPRCQSGIEGVGNCLPVNGSTVEVLADRNGHRRKVVGEGKSVSWGGARTKGKGSEFELTKKMFLHSDMLKLCLKKNTTSVSSSLTQLCFTIRKLALRTNEIKNRELLTNQIVVYPRLTYVKHYQNILEQF